MLPGSLHILCTRPGAAGVDVEHKQDFQLWCVALRRTHYNGCHIQLFAFPGYGHWILYLSVIRDQIHGNSLGEYSFPCILYVPWSRVNPCSFNISLHQETNNKTWNDCNKRGKSLKGGKLNSWYSLSSSACQILPALVCTCLSYMVRSSHLRMYHGRYTLHGCCSNCVKGKWLCVFWNIHMLLL